MPLRDKCESGFHGIEYHANPAKPEVLEDCKDSLHSHVIQGDARRALESLADQSCQAVITSPPYWGLRWYGMSDEFGLEDDPDEYISNLVSVFGLVHKVLRDSGILWLNVGDSYTSGGRTWRAPDQRNPFRAMKKRPPAPPGLKAKDLVGIPWKLAFALQRDGWYLRDDVIWRKPNAQPESVKDRPTRCHEYLFMLTKCERYYYDAQAVREQNNRQLRSVWDINTTPSGVAHSATFPPTLVERCMLLSTRRGDRVLDPFFGSGTVGLQAIKHDRCFVGVELNPDYIKIARKRIQDVTNSRSDAGQQTTLQNHAAEFGFPHSEVVPTS